MDYICKFIIENKSTLQMNGNGLTQVISDALIDAEYNVLMIITIICKIYL